MTGRFGNAERRVRGQGGVSPGASIRVPALFPAILLVWLLMAALLGTGWVYFGHRTVLHALFGSFILGYCVDLLLKRRLPGPTPLDLPLAGLVLIYAGAIVASPYSAVGLEKSLTIAAVLLAFYAINDWSMISTLALVRMLLVVVSVLAIVAVILLGLRFVQDLSLLRAVQGGLGVTDLWPKTLHRASFYHPNLLAAMLNLGLPFALALALKPVRSVERIFAGGVFALCLVTLFLTLSRGGWVGFGVALAVFVLAFAGRERVEANIGIFREMLGRRPRAATVATISTLTAVISLAVLLWAYQPSWLFRQTANSRMEMIATATEMISDRPVFGYGPDTYGLVYNSYGGQVFSPGQFHAHNAYFQATVDLGLVGIIGYSAMAFAIFGILRRAVGQVDARQRAIGAACAAAVASLLVESFLDVPLAAETPLLLTAVVIVIAARLGSFDVPPRTIQSIAARCLVVVLVPIVFFQWATNDAAYIHYERSTDLLVQGKLSEAVGEADQAVEKASDLVAFQLNAGILHALLSQVNGPDSSDGQEEIDAALVHLVKAADLDTNGLLPQLNLALAFRLIGDDAGAAKSARRVLELAPHDLSYIEVKDATAAAIAGSVLEWAGQRSDAVRAYVTAVRLDPTLLQSTYWLASQERLRLRAEVIAASSMSACELGRYAAIYSSPADDLSALTNTCGASLNGPTDQSSLAMLLEAGGEHSEALREARAAIAAAKSASTHTAMGFVLARDDIARARQELLSGDRLGDEDAPLLLALTYRLEGATHASVEWPTSLGESARVPAPVVENLTTEAARRQFNLGFYYFIAGLNRAPPGQLLVRGDWDSLTSPRTELLRDIIDAYED